jgi:hypothetical protein
MTFSFLTRLTSVGFLAAAAESRGPNFQTINPVAQGAFEVPPEMLQGDGFQALHFTAGLALKMRVGRVMLTGQFIVGGRTLRGQLADQSQAHEVIQDAVNRHFVHPPPGPDGIQDLPGLPGPVLGSQGLQNLESQGRGPEAAAQQHCMKIAAVAHAAKVIIFQLSCKKILLKKFSGTLSAGRKIDGN